MGRKPLNEIAKQAQLRILLTDTERTELDTAASSAGVPTSTWARDLLLSAAREPGVPKKKAAKKKTP